jgi:hypothetical protein
MQKQRPTPQEVRRGVGQTMLLLYVGYLGLAVYLYYLIRGVGAGIFALFSTFVDRSLRDFLDNI